MNYNSSVNQLLAECASRATAALQQRQSVEKQWARVLTSTFMTAPAASADLPLTPQGGPWLDGLTLRWNALGSTNGGLTIDSRPLDALATQGWPSLFTAGAKPTSSNPWPKIATVAASVDGIWLLQGTVATPDGVASALELVRHTLLLVPNTIAGMHQTATAFQVAADVAAIFVRHGSYAWHVNMAMTSFTPQAMGFAACELGEAAVGARPFGSAGMQPASTASVTSIEKTKARDVADRNVKEISWQI